MTPRERALALVASTGRGIIPPPVERPSLLATPCLIWQGSTTPRGYGQKCLSRGRVVRVHRWVFEEVVGPVPPGRVLDHLCHNADPECSGGAGCPHRPCFAPDHLGSATPLENVLNGKTSAAVGAHRSACGKGHPWTPETLRWVDYIDGRGRRRRKRRCLTCHAAQERSRREKP